MSTFGDNLLQAMTEALAHAKGEGPAIVHAPMARREVWEHAKLTQAQMASLDGNERVWLSEMGARTTPGQRVGGNPSSDD